MLWLLIFTVIYNITFCSSLYLLEIDQLSFYYYFLSTLGNCKDSSPVLEAYGSFVMDMFSSQSDLDVSINFGQGTSEIPRDTKLQILRRFANKLCSLQGKFNWYLFHSCSWFHDLNEINILLEKLL